jgi:hypothetical protein
MLQQVNRDPGQQRNVSRVHCRTIAAWRPQSTRPVTDGEETGIGWRAIARDQQIEPRPLPIDVYSYRTNGCAADVDQRLAVSVRIPC